MIQALPTSILKKPADRGSFDAMVVAQLQEGLGKRVSQLSDTIASGEPAAAARLAAVEQAKKELEVAQEKQQDSLALAESLHRRTIPFLFTFEVLYTSKTLCIIDFGGSCWSVSYCTRSAEGRPGRKEKC